MPPTIVPSRTSSMARLLEAADQPDGAIQAAYRCGREALRPGGAITLYSSSCGQDGFVDLGEDAAPQLRPRGQRQVDGLGALVPLGLSSPHRSGDHLHGHRRVLLPVDLDVPAR